MAAAPAPPPVPHAGAAPVPAGVLRREFVLTTVAAGLAWAAGARMHAAQLVPASEAVDHLILGAADLDAAMAHLERLTGVRAAIGGSHPGRGTRNALVSLGGRRYLEILAPDPAQQVSGSPRDVRSLKEPRLIGWAAASTELTEVLQRAKAAGHAATGPRDGARSRPDGRTLRWRTVAIPSSFVQDTVDPVPFFIEWASESQHPSSDSPGGITLEAFDASHPAAPEVAKLLNAFGIDLAVRQGPSRLRAMLATPKGRIELS